jgi:hypothetical protein
VPPPIGQAKEKTMEQQTGPLVEIEIAPALSQQVLSALRERRIPVEEPEQVSALDGVTLTSLLIALTPTVMPHLVEIARLIVGKRGQVRIKGMVIDLENCTQDEFVQALRTVHKKRP